MQSINRCVFTGTERRDGYKANRVSGARSRFFNIRTRCPSASASATIKSGSKVIPSPSRAACEQDIAGIAAESTFHGHRFRSRGSVKCPLLDFRNNIVVQTVVLREISGFRRRASRLKIIGRCAQVTRYECDRFGDVGRIRRISDAQRQIDARFDQVGFPVIQQQRYPQTRMCRSEARCVSCSLAVRRSWERCWASSTASLPRT